jgi:hypothetical protein
VIDSGAATSIITKTLLDRIGYTIDRPSKLLVVTANGDRTRSLGIVDEIPVTIGRVRFPTTFQVLESRDEVLILGNEWLRSANALMDWRNSTLTIRSDFESTRIPVTYTKTSQINLQEDESTDDEYEEEDLNEVSIYLSESNSSSEEDNIDYNPWVDEASPKYSEEESEECEDDGNPATFLVAMVEKEAEPIAETLKVGPMEYQQQQQLQNILHEFQDICAKNQTEIGRTTEIKHRIHTGDAIPIAQRPYRTNPVKTKFMKEEIKRMEEAGIVRRSFSPWASPVVIVGKKDGTHRFCVDYRQLNKVTKVDAYPLPRIDTLLDSLGGSNWFTTLDLASGFWQIAMHEDDIEKTAFITEDGLYEFLVMPFGLNNAPGTFQRLMNWVLRDYLGLFVAVYVDDVIIHTKGAMEHHFDHIKQVFQTLRDAKLKIKLKKCHFCLPSLNFLGHVVGRGGIKPDPEKIKRIQDFPIPANVSQLRAALGLFGYYRKFIKEFSRHAKPMTMLLKKDQPYEWADKQQIAFDYLKGRLTKAPILQYPDFERPFILYTDASKFGLGAVLSQKKEGKEYVIAYASRSTNKSEENYGITDLECLAVVWAVQHFQHYLFNHFTIVTDHSALKWLKTCKIPKGKRARWIMELQQYNFTIEHRAGKSNANADALSRMHEGNTDEMHCYMVYTLFNDNTEDQEWHMNKKRKLLNGETLGMIADTEDDEEPSDELTYVPMARNPVPFEQCEEDICTCQYQNAYSHDDREWATSIATEPEEVVLINGSQYLRNLGPAPGDSDSEQEIMEEISSQEHGLVKEKRERLAEYIPEERGNNDWETDDCWDYDSDDDYCNYPEYLIKDIDMATIEEITVDGITTVAYTYPKDEIDILYNEFIKIKNVVANQPIKTGGSKCTDACDTENHHIHTYCTVCKRNLFYGTKEHDCKFGFEDGKIHPEMNPKFLVNKPWWKEPQLVQIANNYTHLRFLQRSLLGLSFYPECTEQPVIIDLD